MKSAELNANLNVDSNQKRRRKIPLAPPEKRCTFKTHSGAPCRVARLKGSEFCIFHDRKWQAYRKLALDAQARLRDRDNVSTPEGVHALLEKTAQEVRMGLITPRMANTITYIAQTMMANLERLARDRAEQEEMEMPLVDLRARIMKAVNEELLNQQEREIQKLGGIQSPVEHAQNLVKELRKKKGVSDAPPPAPQAPPTPPPVPPITFTPRSAEPIAPAPTAEQAYAPFPSDPVRRIPKEWENLPCDPNLPHPLRPKGER